MHHRQQRQKDSNWWQLPYLHTPAAVSQMDTDVADPLRTVDAEPALCSANKASEVLPGLRRNPRQAKTLRDLTLCRCGLVEAHVQDLIDLHVKEEVA